MLQPLDSQDGCFMCIHPRTCTATRAARNANTHTPSRATLVAVILLSLIIFSFLLVWPTWPIVEGGVSWALI
jgi:hypothetical protein